jgi:thiol-disulfide isomerase/thioredoxin
MKRLIILIATFFPLLASPLSAAVIPELRNKLSAGDLTSAEAIVDEYYRANGANSEYAAAVSWLARGAWTLNNTDAASRYLAQTKSLTAGLLKTTTVADDTFLSTAIGAAIEVEAKMLAAQGQRDKAIALLESQLAQWKIWSLRARIQKNINLLTLVGKPAPAMDPSDAGKPVLLFLWAHWCGDCKAQAAAVARIKQRYLARGLIVRAPTRHYGSVPNIDPATPEQEDREIERIWKESYAALADTPHPTSEAVMSRYGVSSTPTLVLIDRQGIVRMYNPYRMSEDALARQIEPVLE